LIPHQAVAAAVAAAGPQPVAPRQAEQVVVPERPRLKAVVEPRQRPRVRALEAPSPQRLRADAAALVAARRLRLPRRRPWRFSPPWVSRT
jgi:hypothetical protein